MTENMPDIQRYRYIIAAAVFFLLLALETFYPLFQGRQKRIKHIGRNFSIVIIDNLVFFALLAAATGFVFRYIEQNRMGLLYQIQLPAVLRIALIIVLFDLWMYIWHRWTHTSDFLWRFHRMHHSDPAMDASTALRFHPGEIIISTLLRWGVFLILGVTAFELLIYETIMLPVIFFHHSNFYLPEKPDKLLRQVIVTPWMHWVHHSHLKYETNSNYGTIFSWWDRLFASFRLRSEPETIHYGLDTIRGSGWQTVWGMLKTPFVNRFDKG
ncbi:MAG: sterol desaturase family protein [candidate division KSB1 bacterium]|nr:sterol desaturase family protein [candidate division KSB1 bacterium]